MIIWKVISYTFNEFIDKSRRKSNWNRHLDPIDVQQCFVINKREKEILEQFIRYTINDCLAMANLLTEFENGRIRQWPKLEFSVCSRVWYKSKKENEDLYLVKHFDRVTKVFWIKYSGKHYCLYVIDICTKLRTKEVLEKKHGFTFFFSIIVVCHICR
jgi:hypothetical protein